MLNKFEQINENKEIIIDDKINENPNNNTIDNSNTNDFYNTIFGPNYAVKEIDYLKLETNEVQCYLELPEIPLLNCPLEW